MKDERNDSLFVDVNTVQRDLGVSRAKAYGVIKDLNNQLREQYPRAIIISGKVNRKWYEEALMVSAKE